MMGLDTPETCRDWRNILRISCASSWFFFTRLYRHARSTKRRIKGGGGPSNTTVIILNNDVKSYIRATCFDSDESCTLGNPSPVPPPILLNPLLTPSSHLHVLFMVLHFTFYTSILYFYCFIFYVFLWFYTCVSHSTYPNSPSHTFCYVISFVILFFYCKRWGSRNA